MQKKFVTEIFKFKIGLSPDLMKGFFELSNKLYKCLRINSQFTPEDPNDKI